MRVLLLTDTHGEIEQINNFAAEYNADACLHCGDIGLFDYDGNNLKGNDLSFDDLSDLEEGTYYVCFYVWVEESDTNALQAFNLYEDIFALIVD